MKSRSLIYFLLTLKNNLRNDSKVRVVHALKSASGLAVPPHKHSAMDINVRTSDTQ
jgi:hypothetical protein